MKRHKKNPGSKKVTRTENDPVVHSTQFRLECIRCRVKSTALGIHGQLRGAGPETRGPSENSPEEDPRATAKFVQKGAKRVARHLSFLKEASTYISPDMATTSAGHPEAGPRSV